MALVLGILAGILGVMGLIFSGLVALWDWTAALSIYFIATCILLILVVLMQKPKGGGLAGAFGGAGGGGGQQSMFGAKTGDMFTLITVCLFLLFLLLGMGLVYSTRIDDSKIEDIPVATPTAESQKEAPKEELPKKADPETGLDDIVGKEAPKVDPKKDEPKTDGDASKADPKKDAAAKAPPKGADR